MNKSRSGRGRKKIFSGTGVDVKFKLPADAFRWLAAKGKATLRSASLVARDMILTEIAREGKVSKAS